MLRSGLLALVIVLASAVAASAQQGDQTYHERLEYDPNTGEWVEIAPPIPGTEEGDLALARLLLARGEYKKARKAFAEWMKAYPESVHWPEGLFYAAEVEINAEELKPKQGDVMKAYAWLEDLIKGWPGTELTARAIRKEMIIAELLLFKERKQKIWRGVLWLSGTEEALQMLDRIIDDYARETPTAEQALRMKADYHYLNGEFEEAELAYARLVRDFPRGRYVKIAMLRSGQSALARFPGVEFDDADLLEAEVYLTDFQQRYPRESADSGVPQIMSNIHERRAEKDYRIGRYYERTKAPDAAIFYYRQVEDKWPATIWAAEARGRLVALGAVPLELTPEELGGQNPAPAPESSPAPSGDED
ncbi:MAG TPA: outer membrane protein assembly factor BamD [Phycisphaerae bacterium]|nr:outer membrane protein assembly factor BamD [Phycisphaerae bacterium]